MADDLKLEDQTIKGYTTINGKEVPIIDCPSKIIITNKKPIRLMNLKQLLKQM